MDTVTDLLRESVVGLRHIHVREDLGDPVSHGVAVVEDFDEGAGGGRVLVSDAAQPAVQLPLGGRGGVLAPDVNAALLGRHHGQSHSALHSAHGCSFGKLQLARRKNLKRESKTTTKQLLCLSGSPFSEHSNLSLYAYVLLRAISCYSLQRYVFVS